MAFTANTFVPQSALANSDVPRIFSYRTSDNTATVTGANYFDAAADVAGGLGLRDADVILCQQSDGTDFYEVSVTAGVVAITLTAAFA